ncbi:unnamed protein product, partial [Adineta steineri]
DDSEVDGEVGDIVVGADADVLGSVSKNGVNMRQEN